MKVVKDTQDIRDKMVMLLALVEQKKISASQARLQMGVARVIIDTLKVEIAAAHLAQEKIPTVSLSREMPRIISRQ